MEIRFANKLDNFLEIAELIYETDKYIYPAMSNSKSETIKILIEMIKRNTIYNYNNCIVAIHNSHIVGLIVFATKQNVSKNNYDKWINSDIKCNYLIKNYILNCEKNIMDNQISLVCVCVKQDFRRQKIGSSLISYLFQQFPTKEFFLDTLKNNVEAINLYTSLGFKIMQECKGFNKKYQRKPICYHMIKNN